MELSGMELSGDEARGIELSGAEAASLAPAPELPVTAEGGTTEAGTVSTPATLGELGDKVDWTCDVKSAEYHAAWSGTTALGFVSRWPRTT
jgi:hypothetical protein